MKNRLSIILLISILIGTMSSFVGKWDDGNKTGSDNYNSHLYLYGKYIFKRENCESCHTLNISENKSKISLDGLNNKFPYIWHYFHLYDPVSMVPESEMPSYDFLSMKILSRKSIENQIGELSDLEWEKLNTETQLIKNELAEDEINIKSNSEVIALIYFLNNIPISKELSTILALEKEKIIKEKIYRDSIWATSEGVIQNLINHPESKIFGKKIFETNCIPCHGDQGGGLIGPNLTDEYWIHGGKDENIFNVIVDGVEERGMIGWKYILTPIEICQVVAYIKSLKGTYPENAKEGQGVKE